MSFDCIILDFDGTFTDVEKEAVPFLLAYRDDLARQLGEELIGLWDETARVIGERPADFGWEFDGRIVAPAHADPYIMATSVAQKLLDEAGMLLDSGERRRFLEGIFRENYPKAASVFRPESKRVVEALVATGKPVYVVTNSDTAAVSRKIDELGPEGRDQLVVYGDAKKYALEGPDDHDLDGVPHEQRLPGLDRPVLLHRGHYHHLLTQIRVQTGATAEQTLVCGDIYELDLALPAALGYAVHLVARPGTPDYERAAVADLPGGQVSDTLDPVLDRV